MIKIEIQEANGRVILNVEGRLAGVFVDELEKSWNLARATARDRKIAVDLKGITCVDRSGRYLLQLMNASGAEFMHAGIALRDILQQIKEEVECGP